MYAIFYHFWLGQGVDKTNATHSNVYQRSCSEFHLKAKKNNFFFENVIKTGYDFVKY